MPHDLPLWVSMLLVLNRWAHIVGMTMLVGGILFFEFVVPLAVEDLTDEQRLAVFGRARWVFRKVIWYSVVFIILSGCVSIWRMWPVYTEYDIANESSWLGSKPWCVAHVSAGMLGMLMALRLTSGRRLLARPVRWMQITLIILLISIFLGAASRYVHIRLREWQEHTTHVHHEGA